MKKGIFLFLVVSIWLCFSLPVAADTYGDFTYTVTEGEVTITGYPELAAGIVKIPAAIGSFPVTAIGSSAFQNCKGITEIEIPDSVVSIGNSAFFDCTNLTGVNLSKNLKSLGFYTFGLCANLKSIEIPKSLEKVDSNGKPFGNCTRLNDITFESGTTRIPPRLFEDCTGLKSIAIPDTVESIGDYAFSGSMLTAITIPDSVVSIGSSAFSGCTRLANVKLSKNLESLGIYAFGNCTALESIEIPKSLDIAGSAPFYSCTELKNITFESRTTQIFARFFEDCTGLKSIIIPDSIKKIDTRAFYHCSKLKTVTILNGVEELGSYAFGGCEYLETVLIPRSVTQIDDKAFSGSAKITIYGYTGSTAETYAANKGIPFTPCVAVTGINLGREALSLTVGGSETLLAGVAPENATNKAVSWSSDKTGVATVDENGRVTAVAPGTANLTVTTNDGGKTAVCTVTVREPIITVTGVSLNKESLDLLTGSSETLTAAIAPEDATNKAIVWRSDNSAVATVDQHGKVTAVAPGTANITVTSDDGGKTAVCTVTVTEPVISVTSIHLNKESLDLLVGSSETLTAAIAPEDATNRQIVWRSDNSAVATVDQHGKVTAVAPGTANITVTTADGNHTAACKVIVTAPFIVVTGISLNKETLNLLTGSSETLTAAVSPDDASNKAVSWNSDNARVATVDENGKVTAVYPGTAYITVTTTDGNKTAACKVTVQNPVTYFGDVPVNAWYKGYVDDLVSLGILDGKRAGIFDPEGKITRAEFAKILAYASGDDLVSYDKECVFADSRNHWSKKNINWAYEHQIVNGKGNGFDPDANISRQEMAVMIKRYADYKQITLPQTVAANTFNDDAKIADWSREAVSAMQQANIINGRPGNIFDPQGNAQRCEAAKMISVFLSM